jgi:hypothetical protein
LNFGQLITIPNSIKAKPKKVIYLDMASQRTSLACPAIQRQPVKGSFKFLFPDATALIGLIELSRKAGINYAFRINDTIPDTRKTFIRRLALC